MAYCVRADEAMHREVNHHFAELRADENMFSNDIHLHH